MNRIPLVITYHPLCKDLTSVTRKHLLFSIRKKKLKKIFTPGFMVTVRAELPPLVRSM